MRKLAFCFFLAFGLVNAGLAQTLPVPTPASSASEGGVAAPAVTSEINQYFNEFGSIYPPAWTHYFEGQTRTSSRSQKLTATVRSDGRIVISGVQRTMPIPVGKAWTNLDDRNNCGRGYVYSAWPVFTPDEAYRGVRPHDWAWENIYHEGKCIPF